MLKMATFGYSIMSKIMVISITKKFENHFSCISNSFEVQYKTFKAEQTIFPHFVSFLIRVNENFPNFHVLKKSVEAVIC